MSGGGIISALFNDYLTQKRRGEDLQRASALLGLQGTAPQPAEVARYDSGQADAGGYHALAQDLGDDGQYHLSGAALDREIELKKAAQENQPLVEDYQFQEAANHGAGVNLEDLYDIAAKRAKLNAIRDASGLTPEQRIMAFSASPDIAPVKMAGGVAYNPFDTRQPILAEDSAIQALAGLRGAQADVQPSITEKNLAAADASHALEWLNANRGNDVNMRRQAVQEVLDKAHGTPLAVDIANNKPISKPQRVKVQGADGAYYVDAVPNTDGGYTYRPALLNDKPLQAAAPGQRPTALDSDVRKMLQVYPGMSEQTAVEYLKGDNTSRQRIMREYRRNAPAAGTPAAPQALPAAQPPDAPKGPEDMAAVYEEARQRVANGTFNSRMEQRLRALEKQFGLPPAKL